MYKVCRHRCTVQYIDSLNLSSYITTEVKCGVTVIFGWQFLKANFGICYSFGIVLSPAPINFFSRSVNQ